MFGRKRPPGILFKHARYLGGGTGKPCQGTLSFEADQVALRYLGEPFYAARRNQITAVEIIDQHRQQIEGVLGATYTINKDQTAIVLHLADGTTPIFQVKGPDGVTVRAKLATWLNEAHIALRA